MRTLFGNEFEVATYARVAPERAIDSVPEGLTYAVPDTLRGLRVGDRVVVPLGRGDKPAAGFILDFTDEPGMAPERVKWIRARDPHGARLTPELVELGRWISHYYVCPLGTVLGAMLPGPVKHGVGTAIQTLLGPGPRWDEAREGRVAEGAEVAPSDEAEDIAAAEGAVAVRLTKLQRRIAEVVEAAGPEPIEERELARLAGAKTVGAVRRLVDNGVLRAVREPVIKASWEPAAAGVYRKPERLTESQAKAIAGVGDTLTQGFSVHVLFGVTGSGKTEVYLHLIERVLEAGRSAIVLVPEISLTPQAAQRFIGRFGRTVAILHSGLSAAQRHHQWALVEAGQARVVVGARSAVFAPVPEGRLGLIVVDEEHDGSYKQDQAPRYHARDVAIKRAQMAGVPVVLGSATPSLETYYNAHHRNTYHWHELPDRPSGAFLPKVEVVNFVEEQRARDWRDKHVHLLGPKLEAALGATLRDGGQAILLLNRRGYANYIACPDHRCGWVMYCDFCDAAMVYHRHDSLPRGGFVRCHHCLAEQILPTNCPVCGRQTNTFGMGTQRIEEELQRKFPSLIERQTLLRMDSDTMQKGRDYDEALERFRRGEVRVLVGTQMISKGLDFPNVRLVGVINADTAVNLPDFRSAERTFQLVAQVAGRSGRGDRPGRVFVQTFQPNLPAIRFAAAHDYLGFAKRELEDRRSAGLPPIGRMARIVVRDEDHVKCAKRAQQIADRLLELAADAGTERSSQGRPGEVWVRGPAPCPLSRLSGFYRIGIDVLGPNAATVQRLLAQLRNEGLAVSDGETAVDMDPVSLL